jgi:hypothetical protein
VACGSLLTVGERELGAELSGLAAESVVLVQQRPDPLPQRRIA